MSGVFCFNQCI